MKSSLEQKPVGQSGNLEGYKPSDRVIAFETNLLRQ